MGAGSVRRKKRLLGKYGPITLSVLVFLLLVAGLMAANYAYSRQQAAMTIQIDAVGRMSDLAYDFNLSVQHAALAAAQQNRLPEAEAREVREIAAKLDYLVHILQVGGRYGDAGEEVADLVPLHKPGVREHIETVRQIWAGYQQRLPAVLAVAGQPELDATARGHVRELVDYARAQKEPVYDELDQIIIQMTDDTRAAAVTIQWLQLVGMVSLVGYFLLFVFYFVRHMRRADRVLDAARRETRDILGAVSEGLFLLDKDMNVGHQHSRALTSVLGREHVGGENFLQMIGDMLPSPRKRQALNLFVAQLYRPQVVESLIRGLNPLRRVALNDADAPDGRRILSFQFSRVIKQQQIDKVLVSVTDISEAVRLEEKLQQEQTKSDLRMEMLSQLLHADAGQMREFLQQAARHLADVNAVLQQPGHDAVQLQQKLTQLARSIHALKGEASAMQLRLVLLLAEQLEHCLADLRSRPDLNGGDFMPFTMLLKDLTGHIDQACDWHGKIHGRPPANGQQSLNQLLADLVADTARRQGKVALLQADNLDALATDPRLPAVRTLLIQLLRNAVAHGIETGAERRAHGKPESGRIALQLQRNADQWRLSVEDDGRGIDFDALRRRAIECGLGSAAEAARWSDADLLRLMFHSGLSTAFQADEDAGRGVGMDVVRAQLAQLQGRLRVATATGRFTRIEVTMPL